MNLIKEKLNGVTTHTYRGEGGQGNKRTKVNMEPLGRHQNRFDKITVTWTIKKIFSHHHQYIPSY